MYLSTVEFCMFHRFNDAVYNTITYQIYCIGSIDAMINVITSVEEVRTQFSAVFDAVSFGASVLALGVPFRRPIKNHCPFWTSSPYMPPVSHNQLKMQAVCQPSVLASSTSLHTYWTSYTLTHGLASTLRYLSPFNVVQYRTQCNPVE